MARPLTRNALTLAVALLVVAAAAAFLRPWQWFGGASAGALPTPPPLIEQTEGSLVYLFHAPTETEELYDTASDPRRLRNLAHKRPEDTARLRQAMLAKHGASSLEDLRKHFQEIQDHMRGMGYK